MRIISCASYYGTGSSAITNYLEEFENCESLTDYEFRFLHDPGGVRDLEYNLVENHNRHNSGYALKKYKKFVDFLGNPYLKKYEYFFNDQWKKISYKYINSLTEFTFSGYWHQDVIDRGILFYIWKRSVNKILRHTIWKKEPERALNELPHEITYCSYPTEEKFIECTQKYMRELFEVANVHDKENLIVDQIVPPSCLNKYIRYFEDIKVFVVDRDPRDLYLAEKYIYKGQVIPTESVEIFCKWYEHTRRHRKTEQYDSDKVFFIRFEDLIYQYEKITKRINQWLDFSEKLHIAPKTKFKPEISIRNTQMWKKIPNVEADMRYIEKTLQEYLYPY